MVGRPDQGQRLARIQAEGQVVDVGRSGQDVAIGARVDQAALTAKSA